MHVAIFSGSLNRGGTERVVANIIECLINQGDTVTLITQCKGKNEYSLNPSVPRYIVEPNLEEEKEIKACKTSIGKRFRHFSIRYKKVRSVWINRKPDVILSFIGKQNLMSIFSSRGLNIPVIVAVRAVPELEYPGLSMKLLAEIFYRQAYRVVFQTKGQSAFFGQAIRKKGIILRNLIDKGFFEEPYTGVREHRIVSVGRIDENKNQKLLIDAFINIADRFSDWTVELYGDGELKGNLEEYVASKGYSNRIIFMGNTSNVSERIKKAGVFVLCSDTEGSPNSLIEAMCLGIPCISTDCPCGGPKELIEGKNNGLLIPVGDISKMQECLQNLLSDCQKRAEISKNALDTRDIFEPTRVLEEWYAMLKNACK